MADKKPTKQKNKPDTRSNPIDQSDKKEDKSGKENASFDASVLLNWISKYKKYIGVVALFVCMVVILVNFAAKKQPVTEEKKDVADEQTTGDVLTEEFEVDAISEVNDLIQNYYNGYADGNAKEVSKYAKPVSDTEKSYISLMSEYVESYDNLKCYTKNGLSDGEYVVSVYINMKFKDVKTAAPGLDFFYLRTDEDGKLYIDNAYSQFNQSNMEESTEADIQALINDFEQADDVSKLIASVEEEYAQAIADDKDLNTMVNETLPNAIAEWAKSLTQAQPDSKDETGTDTKTDEKADEKTDTSDADKADKEETDQKTDTSEKKDEAEQTTVKKTKVVYAMDVLNLRKKPSTKAAVLKQIATGSKLKLYLGSGKNGWVKVKSGNKVGYVKKNYITTKKSKVPKTDQTSDTSIAALPVGKKITLSDSVNVRKSMSETADRVGLAYRGDTVEVVQSYEEGWTKVKWNGEVGYIKTDLIK